MESIIYAVRFVACHIQWIVGFSLLGGLMVGVLVETVLDVMRERQVPGSLTVHKPAESSPA
jgi:hypothetical protein